jgi:hypothetical protein
LFSDSPSKVFGENECTHIFEEYTGILIPATSVQSRGSGSTPYTNVSYPQASSPKWTGVIYDNIRHIGEDFVHIGDISSISGTAYKTIDFQKGSHQSGAYYVVGLYNASTHSTRGVRLNEFIYRITDPIASVRGVEEYFRLNPTAWTYTAIGLWGYLGTYINAYLYCKDGKVTRYSSSSGTAILGQWTSLEAYADYRVTVTGLKGMNVVDEKFVRSVDLRAPLTTSVNDTLHTAMTTFAKGKSWVDSDPVLLSTSWASSTHSGQNQIQLLIQAAADGAHFTDMNSLQYVADLVRLRADLSSLANSAKSVAASSSVRKKVVAGASVYLGARYGVPLTYQDSRDLFATVKGLRSLSPKWAYRQSRSAFTDVGTLSLRDNTTVYKGNVSYTAHCKVMYSDCQNPIMAAIRSAMEWDIWPTLQNCWDFIPYSFVVDWMLPVDNLLTNIDNMVYTQYLPVKGVVLSTKVVTTLHSTFAQPGSGAQFIGTRTRTDYKRWVEYQLRPVNPFVLKEEKASFRNGVEALALIVQRAL